MSEIRKSSASFFTFVPVFALGRPELPDLFAAGFEMLGTTLFLFFSFMICLVGQNVSTEGNHLLIQVACSLGFTTSAFLFVSVFYSVTGGAFNPAISLSLFSLGIIKVWRFLFYCMAQILGGIIAAALIKALFPGSPNVENVLAPGVGYARGVFLEAIATGALVLTVLILAIDKRTMTGVSHAPFAIAAALFLGHMMNIPYTGAGLNPARSFGPAVLEGFHHDHWVYWVGPILGSVLAVTVYKLLLYAKFWTFAESGGKAQTVLLQLADENVVVPSEKSVAEETMTNDEENCPERVDIDSPSTSAVRGRCTLDH